MGKLLTHTTEAHSKGDNLGNSLVVQRLGLGTSTAGGTGSIPGWGTKISQAKIPQAMWGAVKEKKGDNLNEEKIGHQNGHIMKQIILNMGIIFSPYNYDHIPDL